MPKVPAELKPGVTKYIAPAALFWFRWSALATVILGLLVAEMTQGGYSARALTLSRGLPDDRHRHVARPDHGGQRLVRDLAEPEEGARHRPGRRRRQGARPASVAMMASRTNLILSIPMLYCMVAQSHIGG